MTKTITWSETVVMAADVDEWHSIPSPKFVCLTGKTRHGKNRINQHGTRWQVTGDGVFRGQPAWQLKSLGKTEGPANHKTHDQRWVLKQNDPNFDICEVTS